MESVVSRGGEEGRWCRPKVGLSVLETSVAGEEGMVSSSVVQPSVEIEITLERLMSGACGFCPRTFLFGVDGIERESKFGAVFDLRTGLFKEFGG